MEAEPKMTELMEITHEDFKIATMNIFKDLTTGQPSQCHTAPEPVL